MANRYTNNGAISYALEQFKIFESNSDYSHELLSKLKSLVIAKYGEGATSFYYDERFKDIVDEYNYDYDSILSDILSGNLILSDDDIEIHENNIQFNKGRFHPPPNIQDILTSERRQKLQELCVLFGINFPEKFTILEFNDILSELEKMLQVSNPEYIVDRHRHSPLQQPEYSYYSRSTPAPQKDTFKARYKNTLLKKSKRTIPSTLQSYKAYADAIGLVGKLRGRMHNMFNPSMQAICLVMDKTGLVQYRPESSDPLTKVFVTLVMASFSAQKLFTIDEQMHGGLDRWLSAFLDLLIKENSTSTDFASIFLLIPSCKTIALVDVPALVGIYNECLSWLNLMSILFEEQWNLGVNDCATKYMKVPRSGTTKINVNAWNACAGAWGNLLRFIKIIGKKLQYEPLQLTKVLKLTAGDQMMWAESAGKGADPDASVFLKLTSNGIMPWSGLKFSTPQFLEKVIDACTEYSVDINKWVAGPAQRSADTKSDKTSVCGVVVHSTIAPLLKEAGAFGSNTYGSKI